MAEPRYLQMMHNARKYHGVVITAPSSVKSVLLKFLENLIQLRDDGDLRTKTRREQKERQAKYGAKVLSTRARNLLIDHTRTWGQLLRLMEGSILIMDELDMLLPVSSTYGINAAKRKKTENKKGSEVSPAEELVRLVLEASSAADLQVAASATANPNPHPKP
jgi:hypothetical protein